MLKQVTILVMCFYVLTLSCSKDGSTTPGAPNPPPPPTDKTFTISGLNYSPKVVAVKYYMPTFTIEGSIDFINASSGVSKLRLQTSLGWDTTIIIAGGANQTSGKINGSFILTRPQSPVGFSFDTWLVDIAGKESNKLSGTVSIVIDDNGVNWTSMQINILRVLNDIGWYNNQFIGVGNAGSIGTSPDGYTWTLRPIPKNKTLKSVIWTGNQYVTVGEYGTIYTSRDGINWTDRSMTGEYYAQLNSVAWSGSNLVAVGERTMITSPDGIYWTENKSNLFEYNLASIIWTGKQFVAVGTRNDPDIGVYPIIMISTDGLKWTEKGFESYKNTYFSDLIQAGNKTICVGYGISVISTNGQDWTVNDIPKSVAAFSLAWSGKKIVGVGNGIFVSDNGIDWQQTHPGNNLMDYFNCVAWGSYCYVAAGQYESTVLLSP